MRLKKIRVLLKDEDYNVSVEEVDFLGDENDIIEKVVSWAEENHPGKEVMGIEEGLFDNEL